MLSIDLEREPLKQFQSVSLKGNKQQRKPLPASIQPLVSMMNYQNNLGFALSNYRKKNLN